MSKSENTKGKQSERKKIVKFIVSVVAIYAVGYLFGVGMAMAEETLNSQVLLDTVKNILISIIPVIYVGLNLIMFVVGMAIYSKAKKMADNWDGEDEDVIDTVEKKLNVVTVAYNIVTVCDCLLFGAMLQIGELHKGAEANFSMVGFTSVSFIAFTVLNFIVAKLVVDLVKKLNPERRSISVFDMKFQKQWEDSSDEAQKQILYRAGYSAYKATNMVCGVMWGVTLFTQLIYKTGVFPMACVCVIWVTLIGTNSIVSAKLEGGSAEFKQF